MNAWHEIKWVIGSESMQVLVDGAEQVDIQGDYAGIKGAVGVGAAHGSTVTIQRFEVQPVTGRR